MERDMGANIIPHFGRIEDNWTRTWTYITPEYDSQDNVIEESIKPMVDGGTEGFNGHPRVIIPGVTPCSECTIWLFPPQVKFPSCALAETPRTAAHCIEYAHLIKWDEVHSGIFFDPDNLEHMQWAYNEALKRQQSYSVSQVLHILSLRHNGVEGLHVKVAVFVKNIIVWCVVQVFLLSYRHCNYPEEGLVLVQFKALSCRRRLAGHNEWRRKPPLGSLLSTRLGRLSPSLCRCFVPLDFLICLTENIWYVHWLVGWLLACLLQE